MVERSLTATRMVVEIVWVAGMASSYMLAERLLRDTIGSMPPALNAYRLNG